MTTRQALAPWPHHPRTALADRYLRALGQNDTRSMTLLGPSGVGKTEFLTLDLLPLAMARGFQCVYADLASRSEGPVGWLVAPHPCVTCAGEAPSSGPPAPPAVSRLLLPSLIEHVESQRPPMHIDSCSEASVSTIDARLTNVIAEAVARNDRSVMLVFDNVHVLDASGRQAMNAMLRDVPARSAAQLACVYAGSSREGLASSCASLFNRSTGNVLLPRLDDSFVQTVCRWSASRLGGSVPGLAKARAAIRAVAHSASLFRRAFAHVLSGDATQVLAAAESMRKQALDDARQSAPINRLNALQAVLLREVWLSGTELYAAVRRERYARAAGLSEVSKADVQGALKRLERRGLVYRDGSSPYALASTNLDLLFELDQLQQSARRPLRQRRPAAAHVDASPSWV